MTKYTKIVQEYFDEEGRIVSRTTTETTEQGFVPSVYPSTIYAGGLVWGSEGNTTWNKPDTGPFTT